MIVISSMEKLPEYCKDCPCCASHDGHCQADSILRTSEYRPFWCPLEALNNFSDLNDLYAKISRCPPYDIINIFGSKADAENDIISSTACSREEADSMIIHLSKTQHAYLFTGKIACLSGIISK